MKRHLVLLLAATAALMFGASACSSDRATGSDGEKLAVEIDTTIGDTTFYTYTHTLSSDGESKIYTLATFDQRWWIWISAIELESHAASAVGPSPWLPVVNHVSLTLCTNDDGLIADAEQIVAEEGAAIRFKLTPHSPYGFEGKSRLLVVIPHPPETPPAEQMRDEFGDAMGMPGQAHTVHAHSEFPLLEWTRAFEKYPAVFAKVHLIIPARRNM